MSPSTGSPSSAQWHAVTPHTRPLSISILELAPTSVTLALTRSPPNPYQQNQLAAPSQHTVHSQSSSHVHGHSPLAGGSGSHSAQSASSCNNNTKRKKKKKVGGNNHGPDSDEGADDDDDGTGTPGSLPSLLSEGQTFKDMLSHGVVVTLDGVAWSRIVAHVSDDTDDSEGPGTEEHDEEGDWEDYLDNSGPDAEEAIGSASGAAQPSARRRKGPQRTAYGSGARVGGSTKPKPAVASGRPETAQRWERERAVVVVYDLDPSKEHEIELQIVGLSGEIKESIPVSNTVLIPPASPSGNSLHPRSRANSLRSRSRPRSRSNSVNTAAAGPVASSPLAGEPSSPGHPSMAITDQTVIPTSILSPLDAQTAQTRHLIAAAHAERESLQLQIKEARKTAQRSEAALRTEIESMKKSNDKAASNDQRNKQKYLALQEQVKQAWAAAETANTDTTGVKGQVPEIETRLAAVKVDLEGVRTKWKEVKKDEEEAREVDRKNRAEEDKKLADIINRVDKVRNRKEKKEAERAELERKLEDLERQKEDIERKAEEEKHMRRQGYYPGVWQHGHGNVDYGRSISSHPSATNLGTPGGFNPPSFRPRGTFPNRFPSGGRPPHQSMAPPAQSNFFPSGDSSAPWPKHNQSGGSRAPSGGTGNNPSAVPFLPTGSPTLSTNGPPGQSSGQTFDSLHTALIPPQFQHRIYLPNSVRPRPGPNFHPPPSVLAEQAAQAAASTTSSSSASPVQASKSSLLTTQPSFPPLPATAPPARAASGSHEGAPSLASIVTRAVLAPTSALAQPGQSSAQSSARPPQVPTPPPSFPGSSFGPPLSPTVAEMPSPQTWPVGSRATPPSHQGL